MAVELLLHPHTSDLGGGFLVRRSLPSAQRQAVGPFIFFDHFGPMVVPGGAAQDVRPHPHIGLATVTYLFEGAQMHRDSVGSVQRIEPGAINWMTAGRGIVHSERTPEELRDVDHPIHGLQLWAALPQSHEETEPGFSHTAAEAIPEVVVGDAQTGAVVRVLIGRAFGAVSPVQTFAETLYLDVRLPAGGRIELPPLAAERAVYGVDAPLLLDGQTLAPAMMAVLQTGSTVTLTAEAPARLVVIGGEPLDGRRFIFWNFVASSKERIADAADAWEADAFPKVPGETERIPLPRKPSRT